MVKIGFHSGTTIGNSTTQYTKGVRKERWVDGIGERRDEGFIGSTEEKLRTSEIFWTTEPTSGQVWV